MHGASGFMLQIIHNIKRKLDCQIWIARNGWFIEWNWYFDLFKRNVIKECNDDRQIWLWLPVNVFDDHLKH